VKLLEKKKSKMLISHTAQWHKQQSPINIVLHSDKTQEYNDSAGENATKIHGSA